MNNKAVLMVSFGTSYESALESSIAALENDFAAKFTDYDVFRAFTCERIMSLLNKRGIKIDSMDEAFRKLIESEYTKVILQPTHLIRGGEYDKMCDLAKKYKDSFPDFKIGVPLLDSPEDIREICRFYHDEFCEDNKLLVLIGHGTKNMTSNEYSDMNEMCAQLGYDDIFVSTIKNDFEIENILARLKSIGGTKVVLVPLMLTAGGHANNDVAGEQSDSWKSMLESAGIEVETAIKGMGEYPEIRAIYTQHLQQIIF